MSLGQFLLHISGRQGRFSHCSTIPEEVAMGARDQTRRGVLTEWFWPTHNEIFAEARPRPTSVEGT